MNKNWDNTFELLKEYLKENDEIYPKQSEYYKEVALGQWINRQRTIYKNGILQEDGSIKYKTYFLTKERIDKLNEINFEWTNTTYDKNWNNIFENLKEYLKENDGQYPKYNEYYKGIALGQWIITQRAIYYNGTLQEDGSIKYKTYFLTKERIDKLNEINFEWIDYTEKDYFNKIKSNIKKILLKRKLSYKLKEVLEESKNEIKEKEDIKNIEKEFIKSLTIFK